MKSWLLIFFGLFLSVDIYAQALSVAITSDAVGNTICSGTSVTFTATPTGTGSPLYQWKKNGIAVSGATSSTYITSGLVNSDAITVDLTEGSSNIVTSNLVMHLDAGNISSYAGTGSTWSDLSGNGNNASLPSALAATYSSSIGGGSFQFQHSSSYPVQSTAVANWNLSSTNALSVETWVKQSNSGDYQFWFSSLEPISYRLGINPGGNLFWDMANYADRSAGNNVSAGTWHHVVYTAGIESGNITTRIYIDGVFAASQNEGVSTLSTFTDYIIGSGQNINQHQLNAYMGLIRVYNKALSVAEVAQNYNAQQGRFAGAVGSNIITTTVTAISLTSAAGTNAQTLCNNTAITNITYATTGATGATFSGLPTGVNGAWSGNVVTISGTPTVASSYSYTVTLTGGCGNITATGSITVTTTSISITSSDADNIICNGAAVTFTSTVQNGGSNPTYQWYKNGAAISGATSSTFSTSSLNNNDAIYVDYSSSCTCGSTGNIVNSNLVLNLDALNKSSYPGTGTTWHDLSGNHNDVTMQNSGNITWNSAGYFTLTGSGYFNKATTTNLPSGNGSYNLSVWVKFPSSWVQQGFISIGNEGSTYQFNGFRTDGTNGYSHSWWGNDLYPHTGTLSPATSWFNAVAQFDGTTRSIWINGVLLASDSPGSSHNVTSSLLQIGKTSGSEYLNGDIGQALIYSRALSSTEIIQNYDAEKTRFLNNNNVPLSSNPISTAIATNATIALTSVSGTNAQTLCNNTAITNITYATTGATGATFSGLPTGVSGAWSSNVVTISGTPTIADSYSYTVTLTGGCGNITASGTITATAINTVTLSSAAGTIAQTLCNNTAITNITYATTGATGATFGGLPTGVSGAWSSNVVTISGTPTVDGSYSYTVTLTGGCGNITASGTITVNAVPALAASFGNALNYNSSEYAMNNNLSLTPSAGFTVEGWINPVTGSSYYPLATYTKNSIPAPWDMYFTENNTLAFLVGNGSNYTSVSSAIIISTGVWTHIACVFDPALSQMRIYINGVLNGTGSVNNSIVSGNPSAHFMIGSRDDRFTQMKGSLDEVRIWNVARTATQIQSNMNNELIGNESGLIACYSFNQGVASGNNTAITTALDNTSNLYNVTLYGFTKDGATSNFIANSNSPGSDISTSPQTVCQNGSVTSLSTSITGSYTFQWYSNTSASNTGGTIITGATSSSYTPSSTSSGTTYYYVVVTNSSNCQVTSSVSGAIAVIVSPSISVQPSSSAQLVCQNGSLTTLNVTASNASSYQWYSNSSASNSGGTIIPGATTSSYAPSSATAGTTYYYVVVSNSNGCSTTSSVSGVVTIDALPVVAISPGNSTINVGGSITLTASGASSYMWGYDSRTPLDNVPSYKLAVGLRLLRTGYTGFALRIRRNSDNVESDFGFVGNDLDLTSINSFLGASNGYCTKLYDQSGFGNDVVQTNASRQPLFVASGQNSKPVLRFSNSQFMYNTTNFTPPYSVVYGAIQTGPARQRVLGGYANNWLLGWWGGTMTEAHFDGWVDHGSQTADNNPYIFSASGTGSVSSFYQNGVLKASNGNGLTGPNGIEINGYSNGGELSNADVFDVFVFNSVLSDTHREIIEKSIGSYFDFYGAPGVPGATYIVSPTNTTTYTVTGYSANNVCGDTENVTITVLQNPSLSNFTDKSKTFFDASYTIAAPTTSSPRAITYTSSNTAVAAISGTTVNITGDGETTITATQAAASGYYSASISAQLTVSLVTVLTKQGEVSTSNFNYVNRNGALGTSNTVTINGQSKSTKSNDGLSAASAGSSAYQIKQDYPSSADGLYWIANPNINGGTAFQIYADMTTDGGGWTLILCNNSNTGWNADNAILRNQASPTINGLYSIIAYADYIKKSTSGFQYMIDANSRGNWGAIWTANGTYSFVNTTNNQTDITINTKFGTWDYSDGGVEQIMPWYAPNHSGTITTSNSPDGNWWGTLVSVSGFSPAPWMGYYGMSDPGIIWYWVR